MVLKKEEIISDLLTRGVADFIDPDGVFRRKLEQKIEGKYPKDIIIKFGIDPTRPDIHLGHAVVFRKLRQFQDIGCKVVFLIGDFTAQIGDPTGKSKARPEVSIAEVHENLNTYLTQVGKVLKLEENLYDWAPNSAWYISVTDYGQGTMAEKTGQWLEDRKRIINRDSHKRVWTVTLFNLMYTLRTITHARLIERDLFQDRLKAGEELYMHEMLYPVLQGVDSAMIYHIFGGCDLEIGGSDQKFNMLMGRDVMKHQPEPQEPQAVLTTKILAGTDGKEKMSKSLGNYISITDAPNDMYGKVMSIPDTSLVNYFELCTYTPAEEIKAIEAGLAAGKLHPKDTKMRLAREITAIYHGEKAAAGAEEAFSATFARGEVPPDLQAVAVSKESLLADILLREKLVKSKAEYRRLVEQGAIKNVQSGKRIDDPAHKITEAAVYRIGSNRFIKVEPQ
ncbi:MAG: tyrosine--tRNA ligase [bacterium]|nr:tyrosine--tRNA ligase [bacterium]